MCPISKAFFASLLALGTVTVALAQSNDDRPAEWAQRLEITGVTNFFQVTSNLYRGAQPTAEGMAHLKALGIRSIINLRVMHSDGHELRGLALKSFHIGMVPWHPTTGEVVNFLKVVTDTNNLPVFVHCEYGADRSGFMCAMYRVVVCGWTKEEAIVEMKNGGFYFSWNTLASFIQKANVADLKRRAGLPGAKLAVAAGNRPCKMASAR